MAWIFVWIVFVALTTTSAFRHPYHSYQQYQGQNYEESQYQKVGDRPLEQKTEILVDYPRRPEDIQSINQKHRAESSLWRPKRPFETSVPIEYYRKIVQDAGRVSPALKDVQMRSSYKTANNLPKTNFSVMNRRGAVDLVSLESKSRSRNMFIPEISEECEELGVCENSPDYPHEYVEALLAKLPKTNIIFNLDKETPEIAHTEDLNSNQTLMPCTSNARIIYPDKVRTITGQWVFVVNGKNYKVQSFHGTMCVALRQPCNYTVTFQDGFSPICVQIRMDRSMWALDRNGDMVLVTTSLPSCCICELQQI